MYRILACFDGSHSRTCQRLAKVSLCQSFWLHNNILNLNPNVPFSRLPNRLGGGVLGLSTLKFRYDPQPTLLADKWPRGRGEMHHLCPPNPLASLVKPTCVNPSRVQLHLFCKPMIELLKLLVGSHFAL